MAVGTNNIASSSATTTAATTTTCSSNNNGTTTTTLTTNVEDEKKEETTTTTTYYCPCCDREATLLCTRCRKQRYCSKECQQLHWKEEHKQQCKSIDGRLVIVDLGLSSSQKKEDIIMKMINNNNNIQNNNTNNNNTNNTNSTTTTATTSNNNNNIFPLKVQVALMNPNHPMMCYNEQRTIQSFIHFNNCKKFQLLNTIIRQSNEANGAKAYFNASIRKNDGKLIIYVDQRLGLFQW